MHLLWLLLGALPVRTDRVPSFVPQTSAASRGGQGVSSPAPDEAGFRPFRSPLVGPLCSGTFSQVKINAQRDLGGFVAKVSGHINTFKKADFAKKKKKKNLLGLCLLAFFPHIRLKHAAVLCVCVCACACGAGSCAAANHGAGARA